MNKRFWTGIVCAVVALILIGVSIAVFFSYPREGNQVNKTDDSMAIPHKVYSWKDAPVSSAPLVTYKDKMYGFSVDYPSDWKVVPKALTYSKEVQESHMEITLRYQVDTFEDRPIDITCSANPNSLNAQQWITQHPIPNGSLVGEKILTSHVQTVAYAGKGETTFTVYTTTFQTKVCEIGVYPANSGNSTLIQRVLNSFRWN